LDDRGSPNGQGSLNDRSRLLLWDYDRGSLPYDLLWVVMLLLLLLVPVSWWRDPLRAQIGAGPVSLGLARSAASR
jgi:hypothetical protein